METFKLKIYTPLGLVYNDDIYSIETTTYKGRIGMCANQVVLIGLLKPNLTIIKNEAGTEEFYILNGLVHQEPKKIKIFTNELLNKKDLKNEKWLKQKQTIEDKIKKTKDEILLLALNKQLKDINSNLEMIGLNQEILTK